MSKTLLQRYQDLVTKGMIIQPGCPKHVHAALGLTGEAGEVADLIKKSQYASTLGLDLIALREELGDVLWNLTYLATFAGVTVEELAINNIEKLRRRHPAIYTAPLTFSAEDIGVPV